MDTHIRNGIGIALVAIAVGSLFYHTFAHAAHTSQATHTQAAPSIVATFICKDGKSLNVAFANHDHPHVHITASDGKKIALQQVMSASGARYANADESIVFWNKGNTAFMTENGKITFENCTTE